MKLLSAMLVVTLSACTGAIQSGDSVVNQPPPSQSDADRLWETEVSPIIEDPMMGCMNCHGTGTLYPFVGGADRDARRATLLAAKEVSLTTPEASAFVTRGQHAGRALRSDEVYSVVQWLTAERNAAQNPDGNDVIYVTKPITVQKCDAGALASCQPMTFNLADIQDAGLDGTVTFKAPNIAGILYLNELTLHTGTMGVDLEHPLFLSVPPDADGDGETVADPIDRYSQTKYNLAPGVDQVIEGGTAAFTNFPDSNQIVLSFKVAKKYQPDMTPPSATVGGCKALASFKTNAQARMTTNCATCHLAGDAKNAMDLTGINTTDDTKIANACAQVLTRVSTANPAGSGLFLAPTPTNKNHPFNFNMNQATFDAFKNGVIPWINDEAAAGQ